jgi:hypothetical protein
MGALLHSAVATALQHAWAGPAGLSDLHAVHHFPHVLLRILRAVGIGE